MSNWIPKELCESKDLGKYSELGVEFYRRDKTAAFKSQFNLYWKKRRYNSPFLSDMG
jgi:hypothetical protein